ncbi:hypothetical protein [Leifsonia virtsii]|uniref:Uncharacterized protein n=1 Tax=Leifsonia virtsii TaxID=3035915 RepID=A0ABT8IV89_9MICO|nr:hypothetical protein [Leifsonia virtsii]MDN4596708.1 hypothetical protein [Leifsonia virtsii]
MDELAQDITWHTSLPEPLYRVIGRVAHSSALLDAMLGEFAETLAGGVEAWVFVSGQNTEWLIQTCRTLLKITDPYNDSFTVDFHADILRNLDRANSLRVLRNRVVHGTWSNVPFAEEPISRPWGSTADSDRVYWVSRDRQRRSFEEQAMTVADVDRLADEFDRVTASTIRIYRAFSPHEPDWPPFRRWRDLGFGDDASADLDDADPH